MTNTLPFSMVSLPTSHGQSQFFVGKSSNIFQLNFCHGFQWLPTREIPGVGRSTLVIARQAVRRSRTLDPFFLVSDGMGVSGVAKDFSRLWNRNAVQHCLDLGLSPFSWVVWLPFPVMGGLWHCFNHIIWNIFGKIGT